MKSHNASANDAFNLMSEPSAIRDKVSKLRDETSTPLSFGGIDKSFIDSDDDVSYLPDKNDSYDSQLENDGENSNDSISEISEGEEIDLMTDTGDSVDTEMIRLLLMIDPNRIDPFDPSKFDEDEIDFIPELPQKNNNIPLSAKAQIDLLRILKKTGCSLKIHDAIIKWVQHYSMVSKANNLGYDFWTESSFKSRNSLVNYLSEEVGTSGHKAQIHKVHCDYDGRDVSVPVFSFTNEVMSLLHNPDIMKPENIIDGYDMFTGTSIEGEFWEKDSLMNDDPKSIPIPVDLERMIGEINCASTFEEAVHRFCTKPHHMPVPLVIFYDKAHVDRAGILAAAPVLVTLGFFKAQCLQRKDLWRILGYVPNLDVGRGRNKNKSADEKQREHHKVLGAIFRELHDVCHRGGIRTNIQGRTVLLKFFIQFIVGDTAGHNDLCGHIQKRCRTDKRSEDKLSSFEDNDFQPITMRDIVNCQGDPKQLHVLGIRPRVPNVFYYLPFADRKRGIYGSTPFERLHVFSLGIFQYIIESFSDMIGEKDSKKAEKDEYNTHFRAIASYLRRQSERDIPRFTDKVDFTGNARMTGREVMGNMVILAVSLYTRDVDLFMQGIFQKYNKEKGTSGTSPCVTGCREAVEGVLSYSKWIQESNAAGEVLNCTDQAATILQAVIDRFPRRDGTDKWNLPKMTGAFQMSTNQIHRHGPGDCWDAEKGERMHKYFVGGLAKNTQRRSNNFAPQLALRRFEDFTIETAASTCIQELMTIGVNEDLNEANISDEDSIDSLEVENEQTKQQTRWSYYDLNLPRNNSYHTTEGEYTVQGSCREMVGSSRRNNSKITFSLRWRNPNRNALKISLEERLFFPLAALANDENRWLKPFLFTGWTKLCKNDITQSNHPTTYRAHPDYQGGSWYDLALLHFDKQTKGTLCAVLILGFVRFDSPGFPTPGHQKKYSKDIPGDMMDKNVYVVVQCSSGYQNFDNEFITRVKPIEGEDSIYAIPLMDLIGPLCCVPNIWNKFNDGDPSWLAILPYRKWGRHFGDTIT